MAARRDGDRGAAANGAGRAALVEPSWFESAAGGPPLTELLAENQGSLSPFGEDVQFPMPLSALRYEHPTDKPNRAENN